MRPKLLEQTVIKYTFLTSNRYGHLLTIFSTIFFSTFLKSYFAAQIVNYSINHKTVFTMAVLDVILDTFQTNLPRNQNIYISPWVILVFWPNRTQRNLGNWTNALAFLVKAPVDQVPRVLRRKFTHRKPWNWKIVTGE